MSVGVRISKLRTHFKICLHQFKFGNNFFSGFRYNNISNSLIVCATLYNHLYIRIYPQRKLINPEICIKKPSMISSDLIKCSQIKLNAVKSNWLKWGLPSIRTFQEKQTSLLMRVISSPAIIIYYFLMVGH